LLSLAVAAAVKVVIVLSVAVALAGFDAQQMQLVAEAQLKHHF
jgi:hypothetical protein